MSHLASTATAVVAVDGPSGSGKSSVSRGVARELGLRYLDTGRDVPRHHLGGPARRRRRLRRRRRHRPSGACSSTRPTRTSPGSGSTASTSRGRSGSRQSPRRCPPWRPSPAREHTSWSSSAAAVAEAARAGQGIVMEGRDIGSVVLPDADLKVWLVADQAVRAARRAAEDAAAGRLPDPVTAPVVAHEVAADLARRDAADAGRAASPAAAAEDAVVVDATDLGLAEVIDVVVGPRPRPGAAMTRYAAALDAPRRPRHATSPRCSRAPGACARRPPTSCPATARCCWRRSTAPSSTSSSCSPRAPAARPRAVRPGGLRASVRRRPARCGADPVRRRRPRPHRSARGAGRAGRRRRGRHLPREAPSAPVTCGTCTTTSPTSPPDPVREWCRSRSSVHVPRAAARTRCRGCAPGSTSCSASRSTSASTATRRAAPFSPDRGSGCARSSPIMSVPRAPAPVPACPAPYLRPRAPGAPRDQ